MQSLKDIFSDAPVDASQWEQLEAMAALHREWNAKINLISRKDIDNLERHHYAHCLAAAVFLKLMNGARVIDVGTGGGFPGLILAVLFPQAKFLLADSVAKKITVVADIAERLNLKNVTPHIGRVEKLNQKFDFVTGRAVTNLPAFFGLVKKLIVPGKKNSLVNGILYWKGGSLEDETKSLGVVPDKIFDVGKIVNDEYFSEKFILHYSYPRVFSAKTPPLPQ